MHICISRFFVLDSLNYMYVYSPCTSIYINEDIVSNWLSHLSFLKELNKSPTKIKNFLMRNQLRTGNKF